MSKRILVVDDHDVVRQGVRLILRGRPEWQVIAEAEDGVEAIDKTKSLDPDLVILDFSMPRKDGLEVLRELTRLQVRSKVLILTMHDSKELGTIVQKAGASGYVIKTHAARDLIRAVQDIFDGGTFFSAGTSVPARPTTEQAEKKTGPSNDPNTLSSTLGDGLREIFGPCSTRACLRSLIIAARAMARVKTQAHGQYLAYVVFL
jgi:DNA-binding NarL/FixJ family response regulator